MAHVNVWHLLAHAARRRPHRVALQSGGERLDYRQAADAAGALAAELAARRVGPGDRVACLLPNDVAHWLVYFAAPAAGAVLVSLNTRLSADELRRILAHCEARVLLHDEAHGGIARELGARLPLGAVDLAALRAGSPTPFAPRLAAAREPAQLYYTSGTTGSPKGVVLTHHNVTAHALAAVRELRLRPSDVWAHVAPMFHLADAWATFAVTAVGGLHVFLPRFTPGHALDLLRDARVTITNLVPTMLTRMVAEPDAGDRDYALRLVLSGGAPIAPDVVRRVLATFGCDYAQTYGMTETSPYLTMSLLPPELRRLPAAEQLPWKCKTGRAFRGVELRVVDADGRDVPRDGRAVGEIRVRGPNVTPGYWRDPAATAAAFDADGFLRTGDLATIDAHGFVDIVDRIKDVIKTGGETVYSVEVEHVLHEHPAVLECAVVGVPDATWGERVVAAVVPRPGHEATPDDLIAFCRERIAAFKAPKRIALVDALPRTGSGKIRKAAIRDELARSET